MGTQDHPKEQEDKNAYRITSPTPHARSGMAKEKARKLSMLEES
jgi:hypothetical protein